jgi:hypothetical protein
MVKEMDTGSKEAQKSGEFDPKHSAPLSTVSSSAYRAVHLSG